MFPTTARYRFSPALNKRGGTTRRDGQTTQWWLILECDRELGRYYRHLYTLRCHHTKTLQEPLWGTHVSVIRGEEPPNQTLWKALEGQSVELAFDQQFELYSGFMASKVYCHTALDYRQALGLPREPEYPLHLTIGNQN